MKLFQDTEIVKLEDEVKGPKILIKFDGNTISDDIHLLSVEGSGASNVQLDLTFSQSVLVTAFGEKITPLTFRGISVPSQCSGASSERNNLGAFYRRYRAGTNRNRSPVAKLSFQGNVFEGVLLSMQLQPYRIQEVDAWQYGLTVYGSFQ